MMGHCVCDVNICSGDESNKVLDRELRSKLGEHRQGQAEEKEAWSDRVTESLVIMAKEVTATYRIGWETRHSFIFVSIEQFGQSFFLSSGPLSEDLRGEISCSEEALCMKTHAACHSTRARPEKCDVKGNTNNVSKTLRHL